MLISEKGGSRLEGLFALLLWGFGGFLIFKTLPVYITEYQFKGVVKRAALQATVQHWPAGETDTQVVEEAHGLELPITRERIQVAAAFKRVLINVDYAAPSEITFSSFQLHFDPSSVNRCL